MYDDIKLIIYSYLKLDDLLLLLNKSDKISKRFYKCHTLKSFPTTISKDVANLIIKGNHLNFLKFAYRSHRENKYICLGVAVLFGYIPMIKYLLPRVSKIPAYLIRIVIEGENKHKLKTIKLLIASGLKPNEEGIETAVQRGKIQIVRYLWSLGFKSRRVYTNDAINAGHLSTVKFLFVEGIKPYPQHIHWDQLTGKMLQYLKNVQHF